MNTWHLYIVTALNTHHVRECMTYRAMWRLVCVYCRNFRVSADPSWWSSRAVGVLQLQAPCTGQQMETRVYNPIALVLSRPQTLLSSHVVLQWCIVSYIVPYWVSCMIPSWGRAVRHCCPGCILLSACRRMSILERLFRTTFLPARKAAWFNYCHLHCETASAQMDTDSSLWIGPGWVLSAVTPIERSSLYILEHLSIPPFFLIASSSAKTVPKCPLKTSPGHVIRNTHFSWVVLSHLNLTHWFIIKWLVVQLSRSSQTICVSETTASFLPRDSACIVLQLPPPPL